MAADGNSLLEDKAGDKVADKAEDKAADKVADNAEDKAEDKAYVDYSCVAFTDLLASKAPVPGGGGASSLVGAVGIALGSMVGSLTVGKKKYAGVQDDIVALMAEAESLRSDLLTLVGRDAEVFEPLAKAYRLPGDTEEQRAIKDSVMEDALVAACLVPLEIMEKCCRAIEVTAGFADKGSALAISDAGAAAVLCRAALEGASLNVFINTKTMKDRERAASFNKKAESMLEKYVPMAEDIFARVRVKVG